jgi:hypothetical protein
MVITVAVAISLKSEMPAKRSDPVAKALKISLSLSKLRWLKLIG